MTTSTPYNQNELGEVMELYDDLPENIRQQLKDIGTARSDIEDLYHPGMPRAHTLSRLKIEDLQWHKEAFNVNLKYKPTTAPNGERFHGIDWKS